MEQPFIQAKLMELGVELVLSRNLEAVGAGGVTLSCAYTGREEGREADAVVLVTAREGDDALARALKAREGEWAAAGIERVDVIGDALAPATIAHAVWAGRRYAEELDAPAPPADAVPFRRELPGVALA